jgi:hypothetical protein
MPALLVIGKTSIRDALKTLVSHVVVSDDSTAFLKTHTSINPSGGATSTHMGTSNETNRTVTDTDDAFDATLTINGDTQFTGKVINCIGLAKGAAARATSTGTHTGTPATVGATDLLSRSVRGAGLGIGVQAGDSFTIGVRFKVEDNSA